MTPTSPSTTTTPVKKSSKTRLIVAGVVAVAVIVALALLLGRQRTGSTGPSALANGSPPSSTGSTAEVTLIASGLDDRDKAILELLAKEGPLGVSEVARRLGISKSTAWRKLQKLVDMGLVERIVVNGTPLYRVTRSSQG